VLVAGRSSSRVFDMPRPFSDGVPLLLIAFVPLALGAAHVIPLPIGLLFAGLLASASASRALLARLELHERRRLADSEIRREGAKLHPGLVAWRSTELTSERQRLALAGMFRRTVRDLSPSRMPGASPLNRIAARPHAHLLLQLADRLAELDRPVTARGTLLAHDLLTSPDSPLYAPGRPTLLRESLLACVDALDGVSEETRRAQNLQVAVG
jgi:hypothetical protein